MKQKPQVSSQIPMQILYSKMIVNLLHNQVSNNNMKNNEVVSKLKKSCHVEKTLEGAKHMKENPHSQNQ